MPKRFKKISVVVLILALVGTSIFFFMKYKEVNKSEMVTYSLLVNRFYSYGISIPYNSIHLVNEKINNGTLDEADVKVWLHDIISNMSIATETSSIASNHWNLTIGDRNRHDSVAEVSRFFESIRVNLNDIIKTEKDYTIWKQACADLEGILKIMNSNVSEEQLADMDYSEVKVRWKELMQLVHEQYSDSRLLKSYFALEY